MLGIVGYFRGVIKELSLVVWPKPREVIRLTALVIVLSAVVGIYVGALDFGFTNLLSFLLKR